MSLLGKLLIVLNVLAAAAFGYLFVLDFQQHDYWGYVIKRYNYAVTGIPVDDQDEDVSGHKTVNDYDPTTRKKMQLGQADGKDLRTQEQEVKRVRELLQKQVDADTPLVVHEPKLAANLQQLQRLSPRRNPSEADKAQLNKIQDDLTALVGLLGRPSNDLTPAEKDRLKQMLQADQLPDTGKDLDAKERDTLKQLLQAMEQQRDALKEANANIEELKGYLDTLVTDAQAIAQLEEEVKALASDAAKQKAKQAELDQRKAEQKTKLDKIAGSGVEEPLKALVPKIVRVQKLAWVLRPFAISVQRREGLARFMIADALLLEPLPYVYDWTFDKKLDDYGKAINAILLSKQDRVSMEKALLQKMDEMLTLAQQRFQADLETAFLLSDQGNPVFERQLFRQRVFWSLPYPTDKAKLDDYRAKFDAEFDKICKEPLRGVDKNADLYRTYLRQLLEWASHQPLPDKSPPYEVGKEFDRIVQDIEKPPYSPRARRQAMTHILFCTSQLLLDDEYLTAPADKKPKDLLASNTFQRLLLIVGLESMIRELNMQADIQRPMVYYAEAGIDRDRDSFVRSHDARIQAIYALQQSLARLTTLLDILEKKVVWQEGVRKTQEDLRNKLKAELEERQAATLKMLAEQEQNEKIIFSKQHELRDAVDENQRLERLIRELEYQVR